MKILGISCLYHDSAAALVIDGEVKAAVQEERFTRKKHDSAIPYHSVAWVLREYGLQMSDIDVIAYYEDPELKFNRILYSHAMGFPSSLPIFKKAMQSQANKKNIAREIRESLGFKGEFYCCRHHLSHAASAFYLSPFDSAAFLTVDGVGEYDTTTFGVGRDNQIKIQKKIEFPHSLGLLYSAFTAYCGFKINSGEYKLMGLAPYGEPKYTQQIYDHLLDMKEDGSYHLNMEYFDHFYGEGSYNAPKFEQLFGFPARQPESELTQQQMDMAASIQQVINEAMVVMATHIRKETNQENLVLAGGVALNCVANNRIDLSEAFENIWIQPASGDAGGALGAALYYWYHIKGNTRRSQPGQSMSPYLGPSYANDEIEADLSRLKAVYTKSDNIEADTAKLVAEGKIVGWFQGRMEFGPRALGNRSIIGDPRSEEMQREMNLRIKFRESFRPFAPAVLEKYASDWFELDHPAPYMLQVADVVKEKRLPLSEQQAQTRGLEQLNVARSVIPAVTHVDYSARVQTVNESINARFARLLTEFHKQTGCPILINTSFNVRGEPIVMTPEDAFICFMRTNIDCLVLNDILLLKSDQDKNWVDTDWTQQYELD